MSEKVMGTPENLVEKREAAQLLRVSTRTISTFVQQGLLRPVFKKRKAFFHREEVNALVVTFRGQLDLASVASLALKAISRVAQCERQLADITNLLSIMQTPLKTEARDVEAFYKRAKELCEVEDGSIEAGKIFYFAKELLGITEEYLRLVQHNMGDHEPWRVFLEASQNLCKLAPRNRFANDYELASAYGHMETARKHVRSVSYFYVWTSHGKKVADELFIGDNAFDPVISTIFPN